jgi:tetratricopeptide (TPR) repeat protein
MAQRVRGHALVELGHIGGNVDGAVELTRTQRVHRIEAREEPAAGQDLALGMADAPPGAQPLQHHRADHEAGIRLAETALSLDAKNPRQYNNVAVAYANAGEAQRAIELLGQGLRLDPKNVDERFLANMGYFDFMAGDDEAAMQWMLKAADANPAFKAAHAGLAMLYARKGQQARSQVAVAALLRLDPKINLSSFEGRSVESFTPAYREYWEKKLLPAWRLAGLPE